MMKNIPEFRFPEFEGIWNKSKFESVFDLKITNSYTRDDLHCADGTVKNIHYGDIHSKYSTIVDISKEEIPFIKDSVDLSRISNENYCIDGDIVIADASEDYADVGKTIEIYNISNQKVVAGLHTILARDSKGKMVNGFKGYLMRSPRIHKQVRILATGIKVIGISKEMIKKIDLFYPSLSEQQKIADFFSTLDSRVEIQEDEIKTTEDMKKGYMQKIFSQELRFKDENGEDYSEWEEKKLGEITTIKTGNSDVQDNVLDGEFPFFDRGANVKYLDSFLFDNEAIIYAGEGSSFLPRYYKGKYALHQRCYTLFDLKVEGLMKYLYFYLHTKNNHFLSTAVGTTVKSLRMVSFESCKIKLPVLKEQEKIANFLSLFDEKIETEKKILETLKELRKGLLQKMFV